ncbi:UDP-3-O-acyl-N-acetylglucosamine deacetylase [Planctomycetes bacterium K23_9]|uniref:UDP-3-O-acyl-N-acetylglucosamine deacetylase n=1 Tax=Stieleria marina TaxID=1930275 RepID=A0A517NRZ4_9BACT|nr:UDP-3-O-[3-hydroxymyristoyl] N-acetylglucosamine deacetylase [Planctomycetes bacterium K23_9]
MSVSRKEQTIANACSVSGRGYWTGKLVCVSIEPAPAGTGVRLIRSDLTDRPSCTASAANRCETPLRTIIRDGDARFEMVEHLMAALHALQIDNCFVSIDGEEFPGLDGSCLAFFQALQNAGITKQSTQRKRLVIQQTVRIELADRWIQVEPLDRAMQNAGTCFEYRLSFDHDCPIHEQTFSFHCTPETFGKEVAGARTFVTQSQAEMLRAQGVAGHVTNQDLLVFGDNGPIDNELRFADECSRHKTLDLIGDIALAGCDIVGSIVSCRGGHTLNGRMAERLAAIADDQIQATQLNDDADSSLPDQHAA